MKKWLIAILIIIILAGIAAFVGYRSLMGPNIQVDAPETITIPSGTDYKELVNVLGERYLKKTKSFGFTAARMAFSDHKVKPGLYSISPSASNVDIIRMIRSGRQEEVQITFNSLRTLSDLAKRITENIELDSAEFINYLASEFCLNSLGITKENVISIFIPNSYKVYWSISAEELVSRMKTESDAFWRKPERTGRLSKTGLNKQEVYTLASIVEKESIKNDERPVIATVYLNRLRIGMPLQADPTVIFGVGDFTIRRVLNRHLAHDSPYNTYLYPGLPVGPICMPSVSSIDAVLNAKEHEYLYFCAKPDRSGYHSFARTLRQHNVNARAYRNSL